MWQMDYGRLLITKYFVVCASCWWLWHVPSTVAKWEIGDRLRQQQGSRRVKGALSVQNLFWVNSNRSGLVVDGSF